MRQDQALNQVRETTIRGKSVPGRKNKYKGTRQKHAQDFTTAARKSA